MYATIYLQLLSASQSTNAILTGELIIPRAAGRMKLFMIFLFLWTTLYVTHSCSRHGWLYMLVGLRVDQLSFNKWIYRIDKIQNFWTTIRNMDENQSDNAFNKTSRNNTSHNNNNSNSDTKSNLYTSYNPHLHL